MKTTNHRIVNPKKARKVNYKDSKFRKRLEAVNHRNDTSESFRSMDDTKLHYSFSI
jgi:hypothetical protein